MNWNGVMKNMLIIYKMAEKWKEGQTEKQLNHRTKTKHTDNYTKCLWYKNNKKTNILKLYNK